MKKLIVILSLVLGISYPISAAEMVSPPVRIVSLAPSMTEILFALGLGDNIVGVTTYCDYPEEAKKKPKIGGMSNPSLEAVLSLKPDVVVLTTDGNPKEFEERLISLKIKTYFFEARTLSDLPQGIRKLASALGVKERGGRLAQSIEEGVQKASGSAPRIVDQASQKKVLFIVWPEPLIVAGPGTAINEAITLLGYRNIASQAAAAYPKYSMEEVMRQAPDVLVIGKGSGMDMVAVSKGILKRLASIPAVQKDRVCYVGDGLYRLGPRVGRGIEELAECLK
jgi:iron complex transport system substrate-binding protein